MADSSRKFEIRVGLISLCALGLLIAGIMWGRGEGIGVDRKEIVIEFDNASGISTRTPVYLYGVKVGNVQKVAVLEHGARVVAHVNRDVKLYNNASAAIQVMELTGGKKVELFPGSEGKEMVDDIVLPGKNQADIGAMMALAQDLVTELSPVLRRAVTALAGLAALVGDEGLQQNIATAADQFAASSIQLNALLRENRGRVSETLASVERLSNDLQAFVGNNADDLKKIIESAHTVAEDASRTLRESEDVLQRIDRLVVSIDSIAGDVRDGHGPLSRLLYDKSLALQLDSALSTLRMVLKDIDRRGIDVNVELGHKRERR